MTTEIEIELEMIIQQIRQIQIIILEDIMTIPIQPDIRLVN